MATPVDRIAELVAWVTASSATRKASIGRLTIDNGVWAVFVPVELEGPLPTVDAGHLPLFIPATQAPADLPPFTVAPPTGQGGVSHRLRSLIWNVQEGRVSVALVALRDPATTLGAALAEQLPGLDLGRYAVVGLPFFLLDRFDPRLPWAEANVPVAPR